MKRKTLILTTAVMLAVLTSSIFAASQAVAFRKPKPEYVNYTLRLTLDPTALVTTSTDSSNFPVVITDGYSPSTGVIAANVTIDDVTYTFPNDFNYNYTFHTELNVITGSGFETIQETLYFKHLPGHPTLQGRAEEKDLGFILYPTVDVSKLEVQGNFQLTGTGMFRNVEGYGMGMLGVSTGFVVYHFALVKGWPL